MNEGYESVAVKLVTQQGFPLAVGGICLTGCGAKWQKKFLTLEALCISGEDLYLIDLALARALQTLADESLLIAGCSVDTGLALAPAESTGGVLGSPHQDACSALDACEALPGGFSLHTAPGGPGLAALAGPEATLNAAHAAKTLGCDASDAEMLACLRGFGIETFLLVFDGTGVRGCVAAGDANGAAVIRI